MARTVGDGAHILPLRRLPAVAIVRDAGAPIVVAVEEVAPAAVEDAPVRAARVASDRADGEGGLD